MVSKQDELFARGWKAYFDGLPLETEKHGDFREGWQKAEAFAIKQAKEDKRKHKI